MRLFYRGLNRIIFGKKVYLPNVLKKIPIGKYNFRSVKPLICRILFGLALYGIRALDLLNIGFG